jgi:molecular chaperone GrpE
MAKKVKMDTAGMNEGLQDGTRKVDSTMEDKAKASEEDLIVKLQEMEKKAAENYDKYVRAAAELDNYKKRAVREKGDAIRYGNENLLRDILPLVDNMDRAMEHACNSDDFNAFREGLKMLQGQLLSCLQKHGVEQIEAVGRDFDPHVHEAMLQVESKEHEESKVVGEFERGYLLNGRLLRPSKVSVCRRLNKEDQKNCEKAREEAKNN